MGYSLDYLRISVTDRCNLRCFYCMPPEGTTLFPFSDILRYEEIVEIVKLLLPRGIRYLRITGGEPLIRRDIHLLLDKLRNLKGIQEINLTTNGLLLEEKVSQLKEAGVKKVNVSLDTLNRETYARITRGGKLERVIQGIKKTKEEGLEVKINTVLLKGINQDEIEEIFLFARTHSLTLRFIELMETREGLGKYFYPVQEVKERLFRLSSPRFIGKEGKGPATYYLLDGIKVGFIERDNEKCKSCGKLRLNSRGELFLCLYQDEGIPLGKFLREKRWEELEKCLEEVWERKKNLSGPYPVREIQPSRIGG